jgi:hypothetical protein
VLLGLRREGQNLESIFRGLTTGNAPARESSRSGAPASSSEPASDSDDAPTDTAKES